MTSLLAKLACLLVASGALALAGCGEDEPEPRKLPPRVTTSLMQHLESIGDRVAAGVSGACDDIYSDDPEVGDVGPIEAELSSIPPNVDPEIRAALDQSIERLVQLVDEECAEIRSAEQDEQEPIVEEEPPPDPVETETEEAPTETTPPPPETTPTEPDSPPEQPNGRGPDGTGPPGQQGGGVEAPDDQLEDE